MGSRRSLRFFIFAFDTLRLVAVVSALSAFRALFQAGGNGSIGAPVLAFAAPQALFPLMAFFAWLDPVRYVPYEPLFAAGKVVSAVAIGAWLFQSARDALMAFGLGNTAAILLMAGSAAVLLYDLVSALAAAYLIRTDRLHADTANREESDAHPQAERPKIVVETIPKPSSIEVTPNPQAGDTQGGS